jgi:hypothetical protein
MVNSLSPMLFLKNACKFGRTLTSENTYILNELRKVVRNSDKLVNA